MNVIKTIDCERVCNRCGQTYPYDYAKPFIDFMRTDIYTTKRVTILESTI